MKIIVMIVVALLITTLFLLSRNTNNHEIEKFTNHNVYFPNKKYVTNIINLSPYFDNLSKEDMMARHRNDNNYRKYFLDNVKELTDIEKNKIISIIYEIEKKLMKMNVFNNVNMNNYINIDWKIIKVSNNVENSFPHTHGDIIVLPEWIFESSILFNTLIHEKMHIYQRLYEKDHDKLLKTMGFDKIDKNIKLHLKQSNPDVNHQYSYGNTHTYKKYKSKEPKNLMDAYDHISVISERMEHKRQIPNYVLQRDHPYEIVASLLPLLVNGSVGTDHFNLPLKRWIGIY